ncbi:response regulator transcription factor [Tsukamurella sp. 8F]|uniref:response regulator n=1 Tax=unclassified Tsukamurella TaxID=2633480 RepID=UPI0023BA150D|nr:MULTISPECIES: response regulator transcription factor [unclassified Tsukamurella]MDF0529946.1 response regulator transcription factor [Tsukamurella sp. 8J]MDF0587282.1 response regulator transcription factor [Tsukamurella sp. 8F]
MITVLLVDDHPMVREGLRGMIEVEPDLAAVGEAGSGEEAVAQAESLEPDVVLMDLRMPGALDGVGAIARILAGRRRPRIIVVTTYDRDADILRAVEAGAAGYLLKDATRTELIDAVRAAARGETILSPAIARHVVGRIGRSARPRLSDREVEVLRLVAQGCSNPEIGRRLYISHATVKTHLLRIFAKLEVTDRTAAVTTAIAQGVLDL